LEAFQSADWDDVKLWSLPNGFLSRGIGYLQRKFAGGAFDLNVYHKFILDRVIRTDRVEAIHAHYGKNALIILSTAKKNSIPLVVSFHGKDASAHLRNQEYKESLPELFDYASAIIICSTHMFDSLELTKWKEKVYVIPYGIDIQEFRSTLQPVFFSTIKILHAGRLTKKKGVPDLIRVFRQLERKYPMLELHILGDGEDLGLCKELAKDSTQISFYGAQPISVVKKLMLETDIFVLNSRTAENGDMEGLPNAILEAMSFGKPVIATEHAGIPMAISHMKDGILVKERDNLGLENALQELIENESLRAELGKNARLKVESKFTSVHMEELLTEVFRKVLK
jgi:Glycosyltransferase